MEINRIPTSGTNWVEEIVGNRYECILSDLASLYKLSFGDRNDKSREVVKVAQKKN